MILNAMSNFPDQMSLAEISLEALGEYLYVFFGVYKLPWRVEVGSGSCSKKKS